MDNRTLLWVDDDGDSRFPFEVLRLTRSGWQVEWALTAIDAAEKLRDQVFSAVLLDQTLPLPKKAKGENKANVWTGCLLLHWLRKSPFPESAPLIEGRDELRTIQPAQENVEIPVIVVSAFYDDEVNSAFRQLEPDFKMITKPIDVEFLMRTLNSNGRR